ncbi:transcription factor-like 5 protein [Pyxicephalus adspersus]|uniref:transcription factor-like 5 protein n=1 Tax=Pyxicephalus adspersus TaxID=30357 RepID=UPI003B5CF4E5
MSETEYTQLQILYSQMDPQSSKEVAETKSGSTFYLVDSSTSVSEATNLTSQSLFPSTSSECEITQSAKALACNIDIDQPLGHLDFQEMRMMMLSDSSLPLPSKADSNAPNENEEDSSGAGIMQTRKAGRATGTSAEDENVTQVVESRLKCNVRVRLEDRFNRIQSEGSRGQKARDSLKNLVTGNHHQSQHTEIQHHKNAILMESDGFTNTETPQFPYLCNSPPDSTGSSHTQVSASASHDHTSSLQEVPKHQGMSLSRGLTICYLQELESVKPSSVLKKKLAPLQVWNKVEGKQLIYQEYQGPQEQMDTGLERRPLGEIKNLEIEKANKEAAWPHTRCNTGKAASGNSPVFSQSREKKNCLERYRRRQIRMYCDKMNMLVPFCNEKSDKATTLKWTLAFLKYIQKQHGDSLKKPQNLQDPFWQPSLNT